MHVARSTEALVSLNDLYRPRLTNVTVEQMVVPQMQHSDVAYQDAANDYRDGSDAAGVSAR